MVIHKESISNLLTIFLIKNWESRYGPLMNFIPFYEAFNVQANETNYRKIDEHIKFGEKRFDELYQNLCSLV